MGSFIQEGTDARPPQAVETERPGTQHRSVPRTPVLPSVTVLSKAESPSARRFGELLVTDGVITQEQLDVALRRQTVARSYMPIGQVLLANKLITRKKLNAMLQRYGKRSRLGAILVRAGHISRAQLDEALIAQRPLQMPIGQALIALRYIDEVAMRDALCTQVHVNFFDVDKIPLDHTLARLISERFAARHLVVPIFRAGDVLVVAMDDPSQAALVESLETHLRLQIEVVTTTSAKLIAAMKRLYGPPVEPDVDVFARRNILMGPIRDFVVADLAARALQGISVVPF